MRFAWDEAKRRGNINKHGIDFKNATVVFGQPILEGVDEREEYGETRYVGLGFLGEVLVHLVYSEPGPEVLRIISMRKATGHE